MNVSIIIPTLHRLEYLTHTVAQMQAQTFDDWELIIIEESPWSNRVWGDPRIRSYQVMWHSASRSRNYGLELAGGDLVWFVDDDNYYDPWLLEKVINVFKNNTACDAVNIQCELLTAHKFPPAPSHIIRREFAHKWDGPDYWSKISRIPFRTYNGSSKQDVSLFAVIGAPTGGMRDPEGRP
jgi:glycosyltransferase involved in cell wall biosynthesis